MSSYSSLDVASFCIPLGLARSWSCLTNVLSANGSMIKVRLCLMEFYCPKNEMILVASSIYACGIDSQACASALFYGAIMAADFSISFSFFRSFSFLSLYKLYNLTQIVDFNQMLIRMPMKS